MKKNWDSPDLHLELQRRYNKLWALRLDGLLNRPPIGRHYETTIFDDLQENNMNMKFIYEIMAIYGGKDEPIFMLAVKPFVFGADEEEAIVRSKIHADIPPDWDPAFVTIICRKFGAYKSRT